ncbi:MAG: hypothetical protein PF485_11495 [Bacteroidales bacterium]|jgi:hypothetical protein|nr:hypothetical protein [Bacteroidales bacterium]
MKNKTVIRKDQSKIDYANMDLKNNLSEAQEYLNWFNEIEFTPELNNIDEIKDFLTNPHHVYENAVREHLLELTGLKTLPPDIEQLQKSYQIEDCKAWSVSDKLGFDFLQIDNKGNLFYSKQLLKSIEAENTYYATPEQSRAIAELDRTLNTCMAIVDALSPDSETWRRLHKEQFEKAFVLILKASGFRVPEDGNLTAWDLEKVDILINKGFASINK